DIIVNVYYGNKTRGGMDIILMNSQQLQDFIDGAHRVDSRTMGYGLLFLHELHHTNIMGNLEDDKRESQTGPVVDKINKIRRELSFKGANYGERMMYAPISIGEEDVIAFDIMTFELLSKKGMVSPGSKYVKYKRSRKR
ncbi:MAG: hypothetical protein K2K64_03625, partial [Muribaculaceae bacterium]|nr:hypothetical protein [Muribaculaceae bacterium]